MPNGFIGRPAVRYLTDVSNAHTEALNAAAQISSGAPSSAPSKMNNKKQLPFSPEDAKTGKFTTGKGNSGNIVADQKEYEDICRRISYADDKLGECLYRIATEIETMCQDAYKLPWAVPGCLNITNSIKSSMGEFRSLTEEVLGLVCKYARDITEIE